MLQLSLRMHQSIFIEKHKLIFRLCITSGSKLNSSFLTWLGKGSLLSPLEGVCAFLISFFIEGVGGATLAIIILL